MSVARFAELALAATLARESVLVAEFVGDYRYLDRIDPAASTQEVSTIAEPFVQKVLAQQPAAQAGERFARTALLTQMTTPLYEELDQAQPDPAGQKRQRRAETQLKVLARIA